MFDNNITYFFGENHNFVCEMYQYEVFNRLFINLSFQH